MRISDWSSDVCSSDLYACRCMNGKLDRDHPDVRPIGQIRRLVSDFLMESHPDGVDVDRGNIHMWAWYGAYDHVCMVQSLWGEMVKLPPHVPIDRKSTRLNSSHSCASRMPSSA